MKYLIFILVITCLQASCQSRTKPHSGYIGSTTVSKKEIDIELENVRFDSLINSKGCFDSYINSEVSGIKDELDPVFVKIPSKTPGRSIPSIKKSIKKFK